MRLVEGKRWRILCIGIFTNSERTKLVHALAFHGRHDQSPVQPPSRDYTGVSRRQAVRLVGLTAAPLVVATLSPPPANAAGPVSPRETEGLPARLARALRPRPVKSLRSRLNLDFAVLLMRSSYNALDELDCVAMDQFQRDFFLIRQGTCPLERRSAVRGRFRRRLTRRGAASVLDHSFFGSRVRTVR